jgi:hypothetical protein
LQAGQHALCRFVQEISKFKKQSRRGVEVH